MRTLLFILTLCSPLIADELPLLLRDDFSKGAEHWAPTDAKMWKLTDLNGNQVYELLGVSDYKPPFRSPFSFALLKEQLVGSFELTARIQTTQKSTGHRDLCFLFNYQDPSHFYYLHLGEQPDEHSSQVFIVNEAPRTALSKSEKGVPWKDGQFHTLKIVRDVESGRIDAYFDDMETPLKSAVDKTFTWGQIGIGSFDDMGYFDDLELRGVQVKKGAPQGKLP